MLTEKSEGAQPSPTQLEQVRPDDGSSAETARPGYLRRALPRVLTVISAAVIAIGIVIVVNQYLPSTAAATFEEETVALVNGQPVYVGDLVPHLRPALPWVGPVPPEEPVDSALRDAITIRLIAQEAVRRGHVAPSDERDLVDGLLMQELVATELAERDFSISAITNQQAREFFDENLARMSRIHSANVWAIIVDDQDLAKRLLSQVATATDDEFTALVETYSIDEESRGAGGFIAEVDAGAENVPLEVARVAVSLRHDGEFGLADTGDGRYWVVRITDVQLASPEWNARTEQRVRQLMDVEARGAVIAELEESLRPHAEVTIMEEVLERVRDEFRGQITVPVPTAGPAG